MTLIRASQRLKGYAPQENVSWGQTSELHGSNAYLNSLVDSGKFTREEVDKAWNEAKETASKNAKDNPNIVPSYAYTTAIFQSILGIKKEAAVQIKAFARLMAYSMRASYRGSSIDDLAAYLRKLEPGFKIKLSADGNFVDTTQSESTASSLANKLVRDGWSGQLKTVPTTSGGKTQVIYYMPKNYRGPDVPCVVVQKPKNGKCRVVLRIM